jgi:hypothetical protein
MAGKCRKRKSAAVKMKNTKMDDDLRRCRDQPG